MSKIEMIEAKHIAPNPDNPRVIKDDKYKKLVQSLKDFPEMATQARPLIINQENIILGGNMRFQAMKEAGLKTVPVIKVDWDEEKQKEFIIKDNTAAGEWDWETLANEWEPANLDFWGLSGVNYDAAIYHAPEEDEVSNQKIHKSTDDYSLTYVEGVIKKFEILISKDDYDKFMDNLTIIKNKLKIDNNSDAVVELIMKTGKEWKD